MKTLLMSFLFVMFCVQVNSQVTRKTTTQSRTATSTKSATPNKTSVNKAPGKQEAKPHNSVQASQTSATNSSARTTSTGSNTTNQTEQKESPFVGGIHPAKDAEKKFDTVNANTRSVSNVNTKSNVGNTAENDTVHNANTTVNNGVNTNSGAVDRSGQSQFGQTNWGRNSRNTVGESQWTVPPPVTSSFTKQFPDAASTRWSRNNGDTSLYFARYKSGDIWSTSTYNSKGELLNSHIEIPLVQAPRPVSVYLAKQPDDFRLVSIARVQAQGKPDVYEIRTSSGKTIYINNNGAETTLQ